MLLPLIYDLSELNFNINIRGFTPYLVIFVSVLLISKIPTFSMKKIKIPSQFTIFILLGFGVIFVSLIFFTFQML